jgi:hypothetical protein
MAWEYALSWQTQSSQSWRAIYSSRRETRFIKSNRIMVSDEMGPEENHGMVFGNAFLAGLEAVAFDYCKRHIGFLDL